MLIEHLNQVLLKYFVHLNFSVPIVLVGNKTDLHLERKISTEEGKRLAEKWNAAFVETSAKRNEVNMYIFFINLWLCFFLFIFLSKNRHQYSTASKKLYMEKNEHKLYI